MKNTTIHTCMKFLLLKIGIVFSVFTLVLPVWAFPYTAAK